MERTQIIAIAEARLPEAWGEEVRLQIEATYENATTTVIRCRLVNASGEAPASIAVKHVQPHPENPLGYLHSFLNDWAACLFLNSFEHDPPLAPRFYGGDTEHAILVMEDLGSGDGPDTMTLLEGSDPELATRGLAWRSAMADAGARWHIFHALSRVPTALKEDYQRGPTTLRQQLTASLAAFAELAEETCSYPALGQSAREMSARLRATWRSEETTLPYYPAFSPPAPSLLTRSHLHPHLTVGLTRV